MLLWITMEQWRLSHGILKGKKSESEEEKYVRRKREGRCRIDDKRLRMVERKEREARNCFGDSGIETNLSSRLRGAFNSKGDASQCVYVWRKRGSALSFLVKKKRRNRESPKIGERGRREESMGSGKT